MNIEKDFIGCIPELPEVCRRFISLSKELSSNRALHAGLLLNEPVLAGRIFEYINLIYNGQSQTSNYMSINKGISLMGLQKFKNVVLSFALFPVFEEANCINLYEYSLLSANYSKAIASASNLINPSDAYLLGLIHDIGKVALKNKYKDSYLISPLESEEKVHNYTKEEEINLFQYTHEELSEFISKKWELPLVISDAIRYHHTPMQSKLPQVASIIYLSDFLLRQNTKTSNEDIAVFQYMNLTKNDLLPYINSSKKKLLPYLQILGKG